MVSVPDLQGLSFDEFGSVGFVMDQERQTAVGGSIHNYDFGRWTPRAERMLIYCCMTAVAISWIVWGS